MIIQISQCILISVHSSITINENKKYYIIQSIENQVRYSANTHLQSVVISNAVIYCAGTYWFDNRIHAKYLTLWCQKLTNRFIACY